jgi:hypothetical protein
MVGYAAWDCVHGRFVVGNVGCAIATTVTSIVGAREVEEVE